MRISGWWWLLGATLLALGGCFVDRPYTADLSARMVRAPTHMIARPIERTLFIVVAEDSVPDQFNVRNSPHSVRGFRPFLASSLRQAMRPYFRAVHAVAVPPTPEQLAAAGPCAVADVRLDGVEARDMPVGRLVYTTLHIQWAFAIRLAEADEYLSRLPGRA